MPSEPRCFRRHFTICILFFNVACLCSPDRNRLQPIPAKQPDHAQHRQPRHTQSRQDIARITRIDHINATHQRQQRVCPLPHRRHAERQNRHQTQRPEYSDFQNPPPQHRTVEQKQNHQPEADYRRHTSVCNNLQTVKRNIGGNGQYAFRIRHGTLQIQTLQHIQYKTVHQIRQYHAYRQSTQKPPHLFIRPAVQNFILPDRAGCRTKINSA